VEVSQALRPLQPCDRSSALQASVNKASTVVLTPTLELRQLCDDVGSPVTHRCGPEGRKATCDGLKEEVERAMDSFKGEVCNFSDVRVFSPLLNVKRRSP